MSFVYQILKTTQFIKNLLPKQVRCSNPVPGAQLKAVKRADAISEGVKTSGPRMKRKGTLKD